MTLNMSLERVPPSQKTISYSVLQLALSALSPLIREDKLPACKEDSGFHTWLCLSIEQQWCLLIAIRSVILAATHYSIHFQLLTHHVGHCTLFHRNSLTVHPWWSFNSWTATLYFLPSIWHESQDPHYQSAHHPNLNFILPPAFLDHSQCQLWQEEFSKSRYWDAV